MVSKHQIGSSRDLANATRQRKKYPEFLRELIEKSDIILEIIDSRFIEETRNKEIEELIKSRGKKVLYVLNKVDLVKKGKLTESVLNEVRPYVLVSATKRKGGRELKDKIKQLLKKVELPKSGDKLSVGIMGYPNTGKSSVINLLIGRKSARTSSSAGFTKGVQKLKLTNDIVLIDSPGVIPSKEYSTSDQTKMSKYSMVSAKDSNQIKDPEIVLAYIMEKHKSSFEKYYNMKIEDSEDLIEKLGKKKNVFQTGGSVNSDKVSRMIIKDFQEGKIVIQ
jgi:hypothetical protein